MDIPSLLAGLAGKGRLIDDVLSAYDYMTGQGESTPKIGGKFFFAIHRKKIDKILETEDKINGILGCAWLEHGDHKIRGGKLFSINKAGDVSLIGNWKSSRYVLEQAEGGRKLVFMFDMITSVPIRLDGLAIEFMDEDRPIIPYSFTCGAGGAVRMKDGKGKKVGMVYAEWMRQQCIDDNFKVVPVSGLGSDYDNYGSRLLERAKTADLNEDHRRLLGVGLWEYLGT